MRTLILFSPGPNWVEGKLAKHQDPAVMVSHLIRMRELYDQGIVLFGGPARAGFEGMALLETESASVAEQLMSRDPAVQAGILTFRVIEIKPYFDAFSGQAWSLPPS